MQIVGTFGIADLAALALFAKIVAFPADLKLAPPFT
jgi:hypothetical protein